MKTGRRRRRSPCGTADFPLWGPAKRRARTPGSWRRKDESAAVTDLAGRCVLPAFNDSHMHFIGFAKHFINVDLNGASGIREIRERIRRRAKERGSADTS